MALTYTTTANGIISMGNKRGIIGTIDLDSSYATNGYAFSATKIGLTKIQYIEFEQTGGYEYVYDYTNNKVKVYSGASGTSGATSGGTPAGTNSTSAVTGTAAAQTFTGTAPLTNLDLATPAFSGTGLTAAAQVITTTDNQTMTLNQCAGMWLISATEATPPNLILSNTAVTGAPAVLTVQGSANTDAGAYKIVKHAAPVGTNTESASLTATAAAQTFTGSALATHTHTLGAAAGAEVANGTNLSTITGIKFIAIGF